tara:strand:+ start:63 stop:335 length:273 start_codon:yes stop_codon:yes gene_type:complete
MEIYKKRGRWSVRNDHGRLVAKFATEKEANDFAKESESPLTEVCGCWDCKCEPCECDKVLEDVEDVEPVKVKPKTDWNLKNEKRGSSKQG